MNMLTLNFLNLAIKLLSYITTQISIYLNLYIFRYS